jgi:hypothetical protein
MTTPDPDPIVDEVRRIRAAMADAHDHDLAAIVAKLQEEQSEHGDLLVSRQPRRLDADEDPSR